jgi:hypothetical protein
MKANRFHMAFLAVMLLAAGAASQTWGASYKAIDLTPSGFTQSLACWTNGTQQVGYGSGPATGYNAHALLWNGSADSNVDLNPSGFTQSWAYGTSGTQQVGYGWSTVTGSNHALLWKGTAASCVDLNPSGFGDCYAYGISGTQQVGYGSGSATGGSANTHALLWSGSAASCVDLNPSGFSWSEAYGTSGTQQVGGGGGPAATGGLGYQNEHALLWNGTAASYVDLNPSGFDYSEARGTSGWQQVGYGMNPANGDNIVHALLWCSSAAIYFDLNPSGFTQSKAYGTNGLQQVGVGDGHALVWSGSAASYVDLQQFLPAGFTESAAYGIDVQGNIVGCAMDSLGREHAILWQPLERSGFGALTVYNGKLIAGGYPIPITAGSVEVNGIAAWDGNTWQPLGSGVDGNVFALTVYNGKLIAGGYFTTAGSVEVNDIAAWDGSTWQPLGSGVDDVVDALTVYNGKLIAGGYFTTAGSVEVNGVAAWDGKIWQPLGSGMDDVVGALTVYNGKLTAGGYFTTAGSVEVNGIAAWDGKIWQPILPLSEPLPVVPNIVGMAAADANTAIIDANLVVGTVTIAYSNTVAVGVVISQSPVAGTTVAVGSAVNYQKSMGMPVVPNVVGDTPAAANTAITSVDNLKVGTVTTAYSSTVAAGVVISQSPAAGTAVATGSSVNYVESLGEPSILYDDFNGTATDANNWHIPTWVSPTDGTFVGRTQFRVTQHSPLPSVSNSNVKITVETYYPISPGACFYGTDLISNLSFAPQSGQELDVKVRAKMNIPEPCGVVGGIFLYALKPGSNTLHDEIDFELLGNRPNQVQTNIYSNEPLGAGHYAFVSYASGSATDYHIYEIKWSSNQVSWYIDSNLVRTDTSHVPTGPMNLHLNMWVPDSGWSEAYSASLQPTSSASSNQIFSMSVDSVNVQ